MLRYQQLFNGLLTGLKQSVDGEMEQVGQKLSRYYQNGLKWEEMRLTKNSKVF